MNSALQTLNLALQEAVHAFEGSLQPERLESLKTTDSLPNKETWTLASQTVDLADKVVRLLQPPALQLAEGFLSYLDTRCLWAVVSHNVPDILASEALTVGEIATRSKLQPLRLKQVMRILHSNGIFDYDASTSTYRNNSSSTLLMKNHWTQWHRWVDLYGNEFYKAAQGIPDAVKQGETRSAAQITYETKKNIFTYFAEQGLQDKFHQTLGAGAVSQAPGILADYDWADLGDAVVLDIGGGGGDFIASLLRKFPSLRGALLELGSVIDMVRPKFQDPNGQYADVGHRMIQFHVGDFRKEVPSYESYTMKWCLHNWLDEDVLRILTAVRKSIIKSPRSRMVLIESVLQAGRSSRVWRLGDITMMSTSNGQERTESEWRSLVNQSGWRVEGISVLRNAWAAAIDLRPA